MKLSDFGLCKPLDYNYSTILLENEDFSIQDTNMTEAEGNSRPDGEPWSMPKDQLLKWKRNRRVLVIMVHILEIRCIIWIY